MCILIKVETSTPQRMGDEANGVESHGGVPARDPTPGYAAAPGPSVPTAAATLATSTAAAAGAVKESIFQRRIMRALHCHSATDSRSITCLTVTSSPRGCQRKIIFVKLTKRR